MKRRIECNKCVFYKENGFQDMGAHEDVCDANPNIWDFLDDERKAEREGYKMEHCPYYFNVGEIKAKIKAKWKRALKNGE